MTSGVAPIFANNKGHAVKSTIIMVTPIVIATHSPWLVIADTPFKSSWEAAAATLGVVVYNKKFQIKLLKLYTTVDSPTAAREAVPSLPTMAVSIMPMIGSSNVVNRAGSARAKISASQGEEILSNADTGEAGRGDQQPKIARIYLRRQGIRPISDPIIHPSIRTAAASSCAV